MAVLSPFMQHHYQSKQWKKRHKIYSCVIIGPDGAAMSLGKAWRMTKWDIERLPNYLQRNGYPYRVIWLYRGTELVGHIGARAGIRWYIQP